MSAATYVHSNTASTLRRAAAEHPGWPLLLTGHSLGGVLPAVLFVAVLWSVNSKFMLCAGHIDAQGSCRHSAEGACSPSLLGNTVCPQAPSRR